MKAACSNKFNFEVAVALKKLMQFDAVLLKILRLMSEFSPQTGSPMTQHATKTVYDAHAPFTKNSLVHLR